MPKTTETTTTTTTTDTKVSTAEERLVAKYGDKIVAGTVRRAPEGSKYGNKLLVDIRTRGVNGEYDGNTRTVATSDVFQVHHTEEVRAELKKAQRKSDAQAQRHAKGEPCDKSEEGQKAGCDAPTKGNVIYLIHGTGAVIKA